jgi:hypothetical protein
MFADHPELTAPDLDTTLWRYMDLARLLSLLEKRALWFARLDTLGDPYEGRPPKPVIDELWDIPAHIAPEEHSQRREAAEHNTRVLSRARLLLYVSCWHASEVESAAMWSVYSRFGEGLAVRTTFERFRACFAPDEEPSVHGGMVRYVDFESYRPSSSNLFDWATLKRSSYAHEREFLGILMGPRRENIGLLVPVDLNMLIAAVYVAPVAPAWYADLVVRICRRYEVRASVQQSTLLEHPAYLVRS